MQPIPPPKSSTDRILVNDRGNFTVDLRLPTRHNPRPGISRVMHAGPRLRSECEMFGLWRSRPILNVPSLSCRAPVLTGATGTLKVTG